MDYGPLVKEEIRDGERLIREFDGYRPIEVAFWMKEVDDGHRYLYLASDRIDDTNFDVAYGEVGDLVARLDLEEIYVFRIKVIGGQTRLAIEAADAASRITGARGVRLNGMSLGGTWADDVYLYPPLARVGA